MTPRGMAPLRVTSRSPAETQVVAARLQPLLVPGDVILLGGELGAGKTTFTQGLARAMGITEPVTSPTFTLVHSYDAPGLVRLVHVDVYRLEHLQEIVDLGLAELFDGAVTVVEWGEVAAPVLLPDYLEVRLDFGDGDDERMVAVAAVGPRWAGRLPAVRRALTTGAAAAGITAAGNGG